MDRHRLIAERVRIIAPAWAILMHDRSAWVEQVYPSTRDRPGALFRLRQDIVIEQPHPLATQTITGGTDACFLLDEEGAVRAIPNRTELIWYARRVDALQHINPSK